MAPLRTLSRLTATAARLWEPVLTAPAVLSTWDLSGPLSFPSPSESSLMVMRLRTDLTRGSDSSTNSNPVSNNEYLSLYYILFYVSY